jgi:hypothetical protein
MRQFPPSEAEITQQLRAWRAGFSDIAVGSHFGRTATDIRSIRATALFTRDPGWSNCPFDIERKPCADAVLAEPDTVHCWEQKDPAACCTNAAWKAKVLAAIASAAPGEKPKVTRARCHTVAV